MIHRSHQNYELWEKCHPNNIGCISEGREKCICAYHVVSTDRTEIFSFDDFPSADEKFCELTGLESFKNVLFKKI